MDFNAEQATGGGFEPSWRFNLGLALGGLALFTGIGYIMGPFEQGASSTDQHMAEMQMGGMGGPMSSGAPGAGGGAGQMAREAQQVIMALVQRMEASARRGQFDEAIQVGNKIIMLLQQLGAKPLDLDFFQPYINLGACYRNTGDLPKAAEFFAKACSVVRASQDSTQIPSEEKEQLEAVAMQLSEMLVSLYSQLGEHAQCLEWAYYNMDLRLKVAQEDDTPRGWESYAGSCTSVALTNSRLGHFKESEKYFRKSSELLYDKSPASVVCYETVNFFATTLHQEGKTEEAIAVLDEYVAKLGEQEAAAALVEKALRRASSFLFTLNAWEQCEARLLKAEEREKARDVRTDPNSLCDLASVYWEMKDEDKAKVKEDEMRAWHADEKHFDMPLTRSEYLSTLDCSFADGKYHLLLRINRNRPNRQEGEPLEDEAEIERRLTGAKLHLTLDNPDENEPAVEMEYLMDGFTADITSSELGSVSGGRKWLKVVIAVHDKDTDEPLSSHHQLVYAGKDPSRLFL